MLNYLLWRYCQILNTLVLTNCKEECPVIFHRNKKLIVGGGVCLLIALTGVVATASVATTQPADTSTSDTAIMAISSTATMDIATNTIDVATPTTAEPKNVDTVSKSASKEVTLDTSKAEDTTSQEIIECENTTSQEASASSWDGPVLNSFAGIVQGPSGSETYYNLDMTGVVSIMESLGYNYTYWIRSDGVKMYGDYVMCAADLSIRPKGTIIPTSLGPGIVCDTGGFVSIDNTRLDIATNW